MPRSSSLHAYAIVALDADDTLWHNEPVFRATQEQFRQLLIRYHDADWIDQRLYETEKRNLEHFGYGVKGFMLSMIETAIELTEGRIGASELQRIIEWGRQMLRHPVELLEGADEVVRTLAETHRLMLITKGDLYDQERKLARSGLGEYFSAVEVVSEKDPHTYHAVLARHRLPPDAFLMVGDSLRSDVLPVLEIGGAAVHIPYETPWIHEQVPETALAGKEFVRLASIRELPGWLTR